MFSQWLDSWRGTQQGPKCKLVTPDLARVPLASLILIKHSDDSRRHQQHLLEKEPEVESKFLLDERMNAWVGSLAILPRFQKERSLFFPYTVEDKTVRKKKKKRWQRPEATAKGSRRTRLYFPRSLRGLKSDQCCNDDVHNHSWTIMGCGNWLEMGLHAVAGQCKCLICGLAC